MPDGLRKIIVQADPVESAILSGGGLASDGIIANVNASTDSSKYFFKMWLDEDGNVLSLEPNY